jgi:hypothetical protein
MQKNTTLVALSLTAVLFNLPACSKQEPTPDKEKETIAAAITAKPPVTQVEVFSWWTGPGE